MDAVFYRINSPVPSKHKNREAAYKQFLRWEYETVKAQIERVKLDGEGKK
jgi:hypothetical protein